MPRRLLHFAFCLLLAAVPAGQHQAHAQQLTQRLILKDGSFQAVQKYELQGDRVHYGRARPVVESDLMCSADHGLHAVPGRRARPAGGCGARAGSG